MTKSKSWHKPRANFTRVLIFGGVVLMAITIATASVGVWNLHEDLISDEKKNTKNLSVALAEQITRSFQAVDLVLKETQAMVLAAGVGNPDQLRRHMATEQVHKFLLDRLHSLPQANAISLIDDNGRIVNFSRTWPIPVIDTSDRDFYTYLREHHHPGVFVGLPVVNKVTGAWVITLTRRISGPDGEFLGVVLGVVEVQYFRDFYRTITPSAGGSVGLFRRDGTLLVRYPDVEKTIGSKIPLKSPWYKYVERGGGTYQSLGDVGDIAGIVSVQPVREYPLVVAIGVSVDAALASWRRQSAIIAVGVLCAGIGFVILFRALTAQFRRLEGQAGELARTAEALHENETRFRDIAEVSGDWIWETGPDHRFTLLTGNSLEQFQSIGTPAECIGKTRWELAGVDPDRDEQWRQHLIDLDARRPFRRFCYAVATSSGGEYLLSVSGKPVFNDIGEFHGYRGTASNVTEIDVARRRAETAELLLQDAVDSISDGFVIYDREDRFVLCNDAYRRLHHTQAEPMVPGVRFEDLLRANVAQGRYPDAKGREEEWIALRLRERQELEATLEHRLSDGRWMLVRDRRMRNGGATGLRIDITELKMVQAALQRSEERLNRAQRLLAIGSDLRDLRTGEREWSDETYRIFGVTRENFAATQENVFSLIHPDDRWVILASREKTAAGICPSPSEYRIIRPDGSVRHLYREWELIRDDTGTPIQLFGTIHDVTELRAAQERQEQLERQLRHSQKLEGLGTLAGGVAHELNNTLVPIVALSKLALDDLPPNNPTHRDIETIIHASERARDLVKQILTFARKQDLVKQSVDLAVVTRGALRMLRASLPATVRIVEQISDVPPVYGDPDGLHQVIVNLVTNAAQAIGAVIGTITVRIWGAGESHASSRQGAVEPVICLSVADTGSGIPAAALNRIFEPFFTTKDVGDGTGLGLSVVHGIITSHGGEIAVHSEPGEGSEFTVSLPIYSKQQVGSQLDPKAA